MDPKVSRAEMIEKDLRISVHKKSVIADIQRPITIIQGEVPGHSGANPGPRMRATLRVLSFADIP